MSDPTPYDNLSLEDIIEITAADAANSGAMKAQGEEAKRLVTQLSEAQKNFENAFTRINGSIEDQAQPMEGDRLMRSAFAGKTADATKDQTTILFWTTGFGRVGIEPQSRVFEELGNTATATHTMMTGIKSERDEWIDLVNSDPHDPQLQGKYGAAAPGADPAALKAAIHDDYNTQARNHMQEVANGYLALVNELPDIQAYQGPRAPGAEDPSAQGGGGYGVHGSSGHGDGYPSRPGPQLSRDGGGTGYHGTGGTGSTPPTGGTPPDYGAGPQLQSGGMPPASYTLNGLGNPPAPAGPSPGFGNHFTPNPTVVPPVFGSRSLTGGTPRPSSLGNNVMRPNPRGLVRPVIGERIGKFNTAMEAGRPGSARATPPPNSTRGSANQATSKAGGSRPVMGRSGRQPGTRGAAKPTPVRLKQNSVPKQTKTFGNTRAGVRAAPRPPQETTGRVIGRRAGQQPSAPKPAVVKRPFGRAPKSVHGGQDGLNRPVVRNSRALKAPESTTRPSVPRPDREPETGANDWFDTSKLVPPVIRGTRPSEDVDHDPGDFITRYNLGRNRLQ